VFKNVMLFTVMSSMGQRDKELKLSFHSTTLYRTNKRHIPYILNSYI